MVYWKLYVGFDYLYSITVLEKVLVFFRKNVFIAGRILVFSYTSIKIIFICTHKWDSTFFTSRWIVTFVCIICIHVPINYSKTHFTKSWKDLQQIHVQLYTNSPYHTLLDLVLELSTHNAEHPLPSDQQTLPLFLFGTHRILQYIFPAKEMPQAAMTASWH